MNCELKQGRIHFMDEVRGFAVFCMIFYHAFFSFAYLFHMNWATFLFNFFMPAEPFFAGAFIFISGISSNLSHSNLLRGFKLFAVAMIVTLATWLAVPKDIIIFGILHFLSVCMILFGLIKPIQQKIPLRVGIIGSIILYLGTMQIRQGILFGIIPLPSFLYSTNWLCPLGFFNASTFSSGDYFPLLPWGFVFSAGTFIGRYASCGRFPLWTYKKRVPLFSFMGRHALILYLVHQPIILGVSMLIQHVFSL